MWCLDYHLLESTTGGSPLGPEFHLTQSDCYSRKALKECCSPLTDVSDEHRAFVDPQYLPTSPAPQAPEAPEATGTSRLGILYEDHFRRLDRELALLAEQADVPLPKVRIHEGHVPALEAGRRPEFHVPSSVPAGNVPALGVVDVKAEGELVFGSELVERNARLWK